MTSDRDRAPAVHLEHRLPGQAGEITEEPAIEAEEETEALGDGEDELAVGDGGRRPRRRASAMTQGALLVTARAQAAAAAGEGDEELVAARSAANPREAVTQVAAAEELRRGVGDDGPPEAVPLLVAVWVDALELVEVAIDQLVEGRVARPSGPIHAGLDRCPGRFRARHGHDTPTPSAGIGPWSPGARVKLERKRAVRLRASESAMRCESAERSNSRSATCSRDG